MNEPDLEPLLPDEPCDDPDEVRAAWKAEILRRVEEIKSGKVVGIPIEEMFRRSREKYPDLGDRT